MNHLHWIIIGLYIWAGLTNMIWHYEKINNKDRYTEWFIDNRAGRTFEAMLFIMCWPLTPIFWFVEF